MVKQHKTKFIRLEFTIMTTTAEPRNKRFSRFLMLGAWLAGIRPPVACVVQTFHGVSLDHVQTSRLKMESRDEIQEGWVETGDRGRMAVDWMGVCLGGRSVPDRVPGHPHRPMHVFL